MDIKSKNIRYSKFTKAVAVLLLWASLAGFCVSVAYLVRYSNEFNSKDFHITNLFLDKFKEYTSYSVNYAVRLRNEGYIREGNTLPKNDETAGADDNQPTASTTITKEYAVGEVGDSVMKEQQIDSDLQYFRNLEKQLAEVTNYAYIVVDRDTGLFTTNIKTTEPEGIQNRIDMIKKQSFNIFMSKDDRRASYTSYIYYFDNLRETFKDTSFEMYAAAMEPFKKGDAFYEGWNTYNSVHEHMPVFIVVLSLSLLLGISSFVYLIIVAGRKERGGQIKHCFVDRIYTDVQTLLVLLAALASINTVQYCGRPSDNIVILGLCIFLLLSIDMFIGLSYILSIVRHIKNKSLFRHTLLYTFGRATKIFVRQCMGARTFRISVIVFLLAYGFLNSILFVILITHGSFIAFLLWAALNIAAVYYLSKSLVSLSDIMKWVKGISTGNLVDSPDIKNLSPAFSGFAEDVLNLQSGLRNAVTEAVKGERLKTELITNVSHDLKTPLTSIINYVDLLKKEEMGNENIRQYTAILEEKSNRLKQLIDDLLEASKAASGNVAVNFESIDLYSLTLQASAEFSEKAAAAGLDFRIKPLEKTPLIHADGKLMWRIMENLLSNVLKYSQKDSRVYMDVESSGLYGTITIKNISNLPLDIPADQLMERFVRGDRSRSEEGSGLGLAIAKSLAEVQGGRLEIMIDGDLFKVSVSIPLEIHS